jgi:hypothetical protein
VNRLAYVATFVPFIEKMIPREWISPIAIQHTLESHNVIAPTSTVSSNGQSITITANGSSSPTNSNNSSSSNQPKSANNSNGGGDSSSSSSSNNPNGLGERSLNGIWSSLFSGYTRADQNEDPSQEQKINRAL